MAVCRARKWKTYSSSTCRNNRVFLLQSLNLMFFLFRFGRRCNGSAYNEWMKHAGDVRQQSNKFEFESSKMRANVGTGFDLWRERYRGECGSGVRGYRSHVVRVLLQLVTKISRVRVRGVRRCECEQQPESASESAGAEFKWVFVLGAPRFSVSVQSAQRKRGLLDVYRWRFCAKFQREFHRGNPVGFQPVRLELPVCCGVHNSRWVGKYFSVFGCRIR